MIQKICAAIIGIACSITGFQFVGAAELPPDDPGIASDLVLWLRDADIDYDAGAGQWTDSSGNGNDAVGIGTVGSVVWSTPSLGAIAGGTLTPGELDSVRFSGAADDMLAATGLNGGSGLSGLTIIAVCAVSSRENLTRPVGFGSIAAAQANAGNHFNLACDPSIRKDNGQIGSGNYSAAIPLDTPFIRSARMDAGGVDEWFNTDGTPNAVLTNAGAAFTTSTDTFYLGDVRAGASAVPGFGGTSTAEIEIIEVIVYKSALSDAQIADINEWLVANLGGVPAPRVNRFTATPGLIAPGESSTLDWDVERADTVSISPTVGNVALIGNASVSPATTTTYTLTASGAGGMTTDEITINVGVATEKPVISEIVAINNNTLDDEDGDSSDWIEIHNPTAFNLDLGGYHLTDDLLTPARWQFPAATVLAAGERLVIFASGKDRAIDGSELHTNFKLSSSGEDLRLYAPDGATLVSQLFYPAQISDIGYGIDESNSIRFISPTPGASNGTGFDGKVEDTKFSIDRGFFDSPRSIAITTATPGAEIRYTTDGSEPTVGNGTIYSAPVAVATTTTLRAAAFKSGLLPTNVDTHTYLFLDDVIRQPANPIGAPTTWGNRVADYAMDPDVVDDPAYRDEIIEGLKSIRTLSIVVPNDEFFNNPRGIYANPQNDGRAWEREVSFEFLHPDDATQDHQSNGGIRIHGNGSRSAGGQPKHGFRVEFRSEYGSKNLNYKLFPDTNVDEFDSIILRGQNAHGWTRSSQISNSVGTSEREQSQYIRDSFARDIMKDMGRTSGESTFVHLYINGLYWGLYNPVEYPRAAYGASHFGGVEEDYDSINRRTVTTKIIDGTFDAWNEMQALANSGLTTQEKYEEMERHMNIDNLIDYMLMHQYMGSRDGPEVFNSNNMRAIRKSRGDGLTTWIGMPWDMEASMFEINVTRNVNPDDPNTLVRVYNKLRENPEFRLRYADHVHQHCFNGGTLTPERVEGIWETRAEEIYTAIIGESARWGDYRRANLPFTRDAEWQDERNRLLTTYFPTRSDFVVDLLRDNDLYPSTDAPVFSQHGGVVPADFVLMMSATEGDIHYTTDGSDPRLSGGAINPSAGMLSGGSELNRLIALESTGWRYLDTGSDPGGSDVVVDHPSYGVSNWKHPDFLDASWEVGQAMLGYGGITGGTINESVDFGGVNSDRHPTTHFRKHFNVTGATSYRELRIDLRRDDGAILYLNGREIVRSNLPEGVVGFETLSTSSVGGSRESEPNLFTHVLSPGELIEGDNVLAIEVHQSSPGSSDLAIDVQLDGLAITESGGLVLNQSTLVRARTLLNGEWSALTEATFLSGTLASSSNLVVSEIMYHPVGEGAEFLELANLSDGPVDLSGVHFGNGIDFTIPTGTSLPAGGFFLITDFENGTALANGGELITLLAADGSIIESFRYRDDSPWPKSPDGFGASLTRILPPGPPSDPASWRSSVATGGSPSAEDSVPFTGDPEADLDLDGITALLEHAYGTSDAVPNFGEDFFTINLDGTLNLSLQENLAADDIEWIFEHSSDLLTWQAAADQLIFISTTDNGDGTARLQFSSAESITARQFWRARARKH